MDKNSGMKVLKKATSLKKILFFTCIPDNDTLIVTSMFSGTCTGDDRIISGWSKCFCVSMGSN